MPNDQFGVVPEVHHPGDRLAAQLRSIQRAANRIEDTKTRLDIQTPTMYS